ncbi:putative phospholipid hydroperoxide glutathione peroxidase [Sarcoptes scabiei]|uniref:Glutathione peroxidase n=1 Tax=Sarcoptes scabiei TaxID=52283 RepID=A0A834R4X1_SARSC|nr:putative phospholipid hydroperoxide glutathione peroxidase [Sarcoptes scabiei]
MENNTNETNNIEQKSEQTPDVSESNKIEELKTEQVDQATKDESVKNCNDTSATNGKETSKVDTAKTVYEFSVNDIDGQEVSLSKYEGKVLLIVNVASRCGFTNSNYHQLNELYSKYESQGLRIAAFPCNQFAGQEPACDVDIKEFANKLNVKFDMFSKIDVNGSKAHPLYRWLKIKQRGVFGTQAIKWNFTKFLINKEGVPIKRYAPTTSPNSIEPEIKALLNITEETNSK